MGFKYRKERVHSLSALKPGDHIRVYKTLYYHHMLVVRVIDKRTVLVIHYTGPEKDEEQGQYGPMQAAAVAGTASSLLLAPTDKSAPRAMIIEEPVTFDLSVQILEQLEYEPGVAINTGEKAVARARERLGETDYNLLFKNCESFVNWAITTREETNQGEMGTFGLIAGGLTLLAAGLGVGAAAYYASSRSTSHSDEDEEKAKKRGRKWN
ncbi:PREDICTED: uncharacterized protein LOC109583439 [Amphimedon queenslandica]|uniref:LRAT domain-containing protein n=1 Tax=Amphimedon queenslandica TaxID=400682 RepID=A0A1X7UFY7_AMPQE|nr:PREDICTED: uncharacterized protein LOC109583439 [Amphimedon queenslandica]|eukprot:XP_019854348.1 PREDICTED: uncharacterized protein LOC109583439 [Amphimedon queenslandica]